MNVSDFYGKPIVPGAIVAYSLSGYIRIGKVKCVKPRMEHGKSFWPRSNEPFVAIHIDANNGDGPSVVKNRLSLVVID